MKTILRLKLFAIAPLALSLLLFCRPAAAQLGDGGVPAGPGEAVYLTGQVLSATGSDTDPEIFTISVWFNTTTTDGGRIFGFGNTNGDTASTAYDRHIYMDNNGHINFGTDPGSPQVISSPGAYNDGNWHNATATLSGAGMFLYMDGNLASSNLTVTNAQSYTGYWRIGYDNLNGWPDAPGNFAFFGTVDEVQVWTIALDPMTIQRYLHIFRTGTESGLLNYWHLDSYFPVGIDTGFETFDSTSNANAMFTFDNEIFVSSTAPLGPPIVGTQAATALTNNNATINGTVFGNYQQTGAWFDYGTTTNYGAVTPVTIISSNSTVTVSISNFVSQLPEGTMCHYKLFATNSGGSGESGDTTFTIPITVPSVTTLSALDATSNSVLLTGLITPFDVPAIVWFNYGSSTNYGSATSAGLADAALSFNGSASNYITVPVSSVPTGTNLYTIEAWIMPNAMGDEGIVGWGEFGTNDMVNSLRLDSNGIRNDWWGDDLTQSGSVNLTGAWHHVAAIYDGTNRTLYLDGVQVGQHAPGRPHAVPNTNLMIGLTGSASSILQPFNGVIDEVRIWNTNLSQTTIQQWMFQGVTTNHPDYAYLAAYWTMNPALGTNVPDLSGNGNTGVFVGSPVWTNGQPFLSNDVVGINLTGLPSGRGFHFQAAATNSAGTAMGDDQLFQTVGVAGSPSVNTLASVPDVETADISATVNPMGDETFVVFAWGMTASYGNLSAYQNIGSGMSFVSANVVLTNLLPDTTYHWQITGFNSHGPLATADQVFTTLPAPAPSVPLLNTLASVPGVTSADLNAIVNPVGDETFAFFAWGTNVSYGNVTEEQDIGSGFDYVPASTTLGNLAPNTTYHWQIIAFNSDGPTNSTDQTFTTGAVQGTLQVIIAPSGAVNAGAEWQVDGGTNQNSGVTVSNLSAGSHTVSFTPVSEWITPADQTVMITNGEPTIVSSLYIPATTPSSGLILLINGGGIIRHAAWPPSLAIGKKYTMTAVPGSGNVFFNWTGGVTQPFAVLSASSSYAFTMQSNLLLEANFVANPFMPVAGIYNGLFTATNGVTEQTAGMLKGLAITKKGTYSGTLLINGESHAISGSFDSEGHATNGISRPSSQGGSLIVEMTLNWNESPPQVTGTISGITNEVQWVGYLTADFATNTLPSAEYTMLIPPDTNNAPPTNSPGGDGYALITNHLGTATITGALADGTALSQTVPVSQDGYIPIYANLYTSKGLLLGWINLDLTNTAGVGLTWIHPSRISGLYTNGFTNILFTNQILLSPWTNSPGNIDLLSNLSLLDMINNTNAPIPITTTAEGKVTGVSVNGTINPKTGLLKVTIGSGANKMNGYGAILLNTTNGGGYFLTKTNAQAIKLGP